jgi:hypothetical protein
MAAIECAVCGFRADLTVKDVLFCVGCFEDLERKRAEEAKAKGGKVTTAVMFAMFKLEARLRRRYRTLLRTGESVSATTMVATIRTPDGLTETDVLDLAKEIMLDMSKAQEERHSRRLG